MGILNNYLDSFEMRDFDLLDRENEKRLFDQIDQRVDRRHYKNLRPMRSAIKSQIPIRNLEFNLILGNPFHSLHEHLEFLVQSLSLSFLSLFLLVFVLISETTFLEIQIFGLNTRLSVELNVIGFLFTYNI
jgi:hypothetical protein